MIDIHTHILPGIDDGPKNIDESNLLIDTLKEQGVKKIIATPHINETNRKIDKNFIRGKINMLKKKIDIFEGYEVNLSHIIEGFEDYTISSTSYILVEFSPFTSITFIEKHIQNVLLKGLKPIIAHIERFINDKKLLKKLKNDGVLFQVNSTTFVKEKKWQGFVKEGIVDFIASDIHPKREVKMKEAFDILTKLDKFLPEKIFIQNPYLIIKNQPIF